MREDKDARRRLRDAIKDELVRIGLKTVVQQAIYELQENGYQPEQRRRPKLEVIK